MAEERAGTPEELAITLAKVAEQKAQGTSPEADAVEESTRLVVGTDPFLKLFSDCAKNASSGELVEAMAIDRVGCVVKTTAVLENSIAVTTVFVPGVKIVDTDNDGRKLVHF